ncbi:hypothetical protein A9Q84_06320 [Halobacteriovorax marinus]|uniref:Gingipain domain-containing protein n=1 Tax=Halobacteriovorax marinus TaxID=97084 RepID=A0A1Y5FF03_9BACT|nr:hypothetical protein A9Q84_06320 [Halobacteriovorax marinus]
MTKWFWPLIMLIFSQSLFAGNLVKHSFNSTGDALEVSWTIGKQLLSITESENQGPMVFSNIELSGWSNTKTVGLPSLPFKSVLLKGYPSDFQAELSAKKVFELDRVAPSPAQEMPCRCDVIPWKFNVDFSEEAYNAENREHVFIEYIGKFRGTPITRVRFSPLAYNNKAGLRFVDIGSVIIRSKSKIRKFTMSSKGKGYYIFAPSKFKEALAPLLARRRSEGLDAKFMSLEKLGTDFEEIKNSIHNLYKASKFTYALIIGHEEIFPTEYVETRFDGSTPTDMHYYTMDGEDDVIPDVLYGRLSVDTSEELEKVILKTLEFEDRSWKSSKGASRMIAIASDEGSAPSDVDYVRSMQAPMKDKFNWISSEFLQYNNNSTPENIVSKISDGSIWLNYIGHGSGFSWPSINSEEFTTQHLQDLTAGAVKPIVIDVACQNGRYSNEGRMGETFIRGGDSAGINGAVAYYGGSVDISWDPPAVMAIGISKALGENNNRRLIDVIWQGQLYLLENYDDREGALENFVWYHLQGDPLLNLSKLK